MMPHPGMHSLVIFSRHQVLKIKSKLQHTFETHQLSLITNGCYYLAMGSFLNKIYFSKKSNNFDLFILLNY